MQNLSHHSNIVCDESVFLVPVMTILYILLTVITIAAHISSVPSALSIMFSSTFGLDAMHGALLGSTVLWGVKRSVNSSRAGMAESVDLTSAAEVDHPGETGPVSSLSVFIDVAVCICTGPLILSSNCLNISNLDGRMLHVEQGAAVMSKYAASGVVDIAWTQATVSTLLPGLGTIIIALCLLFFSVTTDLNHLAGAGNEQLKVCHPDFQDIKIIAGQISGPTDNPNADWKTR